MFCAALLVCGGILYLLFATRGPCDLMALPFEELSAKLNVAKKGLDVELRASSPLAALEVNGKRIMFAMQQCCELREAGRISEATFRECNGLVRLAEGTLIDLDAAVEGGDAQQAANAVREVSTRGLVLAKRLEAIRAADVSDPRSVVPLTLRIREPDDAPTPAAEEEEPEPPPVAAESVRPREPLGTPGPAELVLDPPAKAPTFREALPPPKLTD